MIKLHISPWYDHADHADGGIRRVVEAEIEHLPKFGIQPVKNLAEADIIQNHGGMMIKRAGVPMIHTGHGLYWSRYDWGESYQEVNEAVVRSMKMAVAHTVPSKWVGRAVRRGGFFYPEVIYHGVDSKDFTPQADNDGFVLWNKARADAVSDPSDLMKIASVMPGTKFLTTIGTETPNVRIAGVMDYDHMKQVVARAGVYLCTVRETFGIGTLEAMALGVPIAGWNWGGQAEIIRQGETGYLAPPGDYKALSECIARCFMERDRLSSNCIEDARENWRWEPRIEQYANLVKAVYNDTYLEKRPKVSIIVTAYKLDKYLPQCLDSVVAQTYQDYDCLVIDDALQDSTQKIVEDYARKDARIRYVRPPENLGLAGARNFGLMKARGRYIRHLDADDFLAENAVALEASALDADPSLHIAYGHLETVREDGSRVLNSIGEPERGGWPPPKFSWIEQMAHLNQLPSCVMMRREVLERSGGYRVRMKRNEDAEFWCRVTSLGFRAFKITQAVTYFHRMREDSKGAIEWKESGAEPDWTAWFPWRVGSADYRQASSLLHRYHWQHPKPHLVPFGSQGRPDGTDGSVTTQGFRKFWYVHDYSYPVVSIIVTCGPGHEPVLIDALDSIQAQSYPDWECVVVNDTGKPWGPNLKGAPWATVVNMEGNQGAAAARNEGYKYTRGKFIVWMDADDYWMPWFLDMMVAHAERNDGVICSDLIMDKNGKKSIYRYADFECGRAHLGMQYPGSSILTPRKITEAVVKAQGGFDTQIPGMEDWDYQVCVHSLGFCAYHVAEPLFVYRMGTSTKRERDYAKIDAITAYMDVKWQKYRKGTEKMGCGCGTPTQVNSIPNSTMAASGNFDPNKSGLQADMATQMVRVEYVGPIEQTFSIRSRVDASIMYRFNNNDHKERNVFLQDAEFLTSMTDAFGTPLYRQIVAAPVLEQVDPSSFLGEAILA